MIQIIKLYFIISLLLCVQKIGGSIKLDYSVKNATRGQFPFFAFLHAPVSGHYHQCGATLIHPLWLLTVAHCFSNNHNEKTAIKSKNPIIAYMGSHKMYDKLSCRREVAEIHIHPDYKVEYGLLANIKMENDLALLKLHNPFQLNRRIQVIHLPTPNLNASSKSRRCIFGIIVLTAKNYIQYFEIQSQKPNEMMLFSSRSASFYAEGKTSPLGAAYICYRNVNGYKIPVQFGVNTGSTFNNKLTEYEDLEQHMEFIMKYITDVTVFRRPHGWRVYKPQKFVLSEMDTSAADASSRPIYHHCYYVVLLIFFMYF